MGHTFFVDGITATQADVIANWRRGCHAGRAVVPVDFHREIDRGEAAQPVDVAAFEAVQAVYAKELAADRSRGLAIAYQVFGGERGALKRLAVPRTTAVTWLLAFAREAETAALASDRSAAKIPQADPYRLTTHEFARAAKRDVPFVPMQPRALVGGRGGA